MDREGSAILDVRDLSVTFSSRRIVLKAVDSISFEILAGHTLGLVGESGSGKSSVCRAVLGLERKRTRGSVTFCGKEIAHASPRALRRLASDAQIVFQDPYGSFDPRQKVLKALLEQLRVRGMRRDDAVRAATACIDEVALSVDVVDKFPHQLSGGELQRAAIARAFSTTPKFVVLDEPTSALDVSVKGQIVNLLRKLQSHYGTTYLIVSHDLSVIQNVASTIGVMYAGQIVELGTTSAIVDEPKHPYTCALMDAVPRPSWSSSGRPKVRLRGELERDVDDPAGCVLRPRCWLWQELGRPSRCVTETPRLSGDAEHQAACHFSNSVPAALRSVQRTDPASGGSGHELVVETQE